MYSHTVIRKQRFWLLTKRIFTSFSFFMVSDTSEMDVWAIKQVRVYPLFLILVLHISRTISIAIHVFEQSRLCLLFHWIITMQNTILISSIMICGGPIVRPLVVLLIISWQLWMIAIGLCWRSYWQKKWGLNVYTSKQKSGKISEVPRSTRKAPLPSIQYNMITISDI